MLSPRNSVIGHLWDAFKNRRVRKRRVVSRNPQFHGDDVIDNITCELKGTESINTQTEHTLFVRENVSYIYNIH